MVASGTLPTSPMLMVTSIGSRLLTVAGSTPRGKLLILSTAFFTSTSTWLASAFSFSSTLTVDRFSCEAEVTRSMPSTPTKFSSIFTVTPSSTSLGVAPG